MAESSVALAAIGLVSAILAMVVKPLFSLLKNNTRAQDRTAKAMESLVQETRKGNKEAAERNGHLGEQNIQITELIAKHTSTMEKNFGIIEDKLTKQKVEEQIVEHQVIKET